MPHFTGLRSEKLRNLPEVTQLVSGGAKFQAERSASEPRKPRKGPRKPSAFLSPQSIKGDLLEPQGLYADQRQ